MLALTGCDRECVCPDPRASAMPNLYEQRVTIRCEPELADVSACVNNPGHGDCKLYVHRLVDCNYREALLASPVK